MSDTLDIDAMIDARLAAHRRAEQAGGAPVIPYTPAPFEREWQAKNAARRAEEDRRRIEAEQAIADDAARARIAANVRRRRNQPEIKRLRAEIEAARVDLRPVAGEYASLSGRVRRLETELESLT